MGPSVNLFERALIDNLTFDIGPPIEITLTDNRKTLISINKTKKTTVVRLARYFAWADYEIWKELSKYINGETTRLPERIMDFAKRQTLPEDVARKALRSLKPVGNVSDLGKMADSINRRYFNGALDVNITWGQASGVKRGRARVKSIRMGSYDEKLNLIRIHPVLDSETTNKEYLELVIYHEMIHKKLAENGGRKKNGKTHNAEFKKLEKEYASYHTAIAWEKENLDKLFLARRKL